MRIVTYFIEVFETFILMKEFKVPAWEFYGWKNEKINFPETWTVNEQRMKGHDLPPIDMKEVANQLQDPVGTEPLHRLAKGRKKCCIIFDDMTRPTKTYQYTDWEDLRDCE